MKKLNLTEMESLQAGSPEKCVEFVVGSAMLLVTDPVFFLIFYDPSLSACLFE
jgi:hypothetical protein